MTGRLRYVLVILSALLVVGVVAFLTIPKAIEHREAQSTEILPQETDSEAETDETVPESGGESEETEASLVEYTDAPDGTLTGLRRYFHRKLVIDMEKTHLYLNVRRAPDDSSEILAVLWPADIVPYDAKQGDWYRVVMDGYKGFVHADYVLTDDAALEYRKSSVAYAAMMKENDTPLFVSDVNHVTIRAAKGEAYRIVGLTEECYLLAIGSDRYEKLYCMKKDVVTYYLFQPPGDENGLTEREAEVMASLEISENIDRTREIQAEAAEERAAYEAMKASLEAASRAEEASRLAASSKAAAEAAARAATAWQNSVSPAAPDETVSEDGLLYLGVFRVTAYCHCTKCCGVWGHDDPNYQAHGASGIDLVNDYTVAVNPNQIPFGTKLLVIRRDSAGNEISRAEYLAADMGVDANCLDIYKRVHRDASAVGMYFAEVYRISP